MLNIQAISSFLKRLSGREKLILYGASLAISIMLLDRLIISPISNKLSALDKRIEERKASIIRNLKILSYKDRILSETAKYKSLAKSFRSEEDETSSLLKETEVLANKSSIYLIDMKPRGLAKVGATTKCMITLSCEAQMEQLVEFMYDIESSELVLIIEEYRISPKSAESSVARCSMTISKLVIP